MHALSLAVLDGVTGGATASDDSFGRCGPGSRWAWLGDVRTPQCAAHDAVVRGSLERGSSQVGAHVRALPLLPAAVGSWVAAKVRGP